MPLTDSSVHSHTGWRLHGPPPARQTLSPNQYWTIDGPTSAEEVLDSPFRFGQPWPEDLRKTGGSPTTKELRKSIVVLVMTVAVALTLAEFSLRDERVAFAIASLLVVLMVVSYLRNARWRARHHGP
jgi:hypothetical protein